MMDNDRLSRVVPRHNATYRSDETTSTCNPSIQTYALCFIDRLPTETLEAIFICYACDYFTTHNGDHLYTAPDWVNISYVNRRWRNVALNCSSLWSYIFIASPRWTEELLTRSKEASLKFKLYMVTYRPKEDRSVWEAMKHLGRVQELTLDFPFCAHHWELLSSPAPRLEYLEIDPRHNFYHFEKCRLGVPFEGDTPALRTLILSNYPMPLHSLKLNGLTTLHLLFVFEQDATQFLAMLGCMPELRVLRLAHALANASVLLSNTVSCPFQKVNLPHLSSLFITELLSMVVALLSCVNLPSKTKLDLDCGVDRDFLDNYLILSSLLARRFHVPGDEALSTPTIRSLVLTSLSDHAEIIFSSSEHDRNAFQRDDIPLRVKLHLSDLTRADRDRILSNLCCSIPLPNVRTLHFTHQVYPAFPVDFWTHVIGHLGGVHYIKVTLIQDIPTIPRDPSRNQRDEPDADRDGRRALAPALEELELDLCPLPEEWFTLGYVGPLEHPSIRALCDALLTRRDPRGRLALTYIPRFRLGSTGKLFETVTGWWESGKFHVAERAS